MNNATDPDARIYPCIECGKKRSKNEGGTTFTVCDKCWEKKHGKDDPPQDPPSPEPPSAPFSVEEQLRKWAINQIVARQEEYRCPGERPFLDDEIERIIADGGDQYEIHVLKRGELERLRTENQRQSDLIAEIKNVVSGCCPISCGHDACWPKRFIAKAIARHESEETR